MKEKSDPSQDILFIYWYFTLTIILFCLKKAGSDIIFYSFLALLPAPLIKLQFSLLISTEITWKVSFAHTTKWK